MGEGAAQPDSAGASRKNATAAAPGEGSEHSGMGEGAAQPNSVGASGKNATAAAPSEGSQRSGMSKRHNDAKGNSISQLNEEGVQLFKKREFKEALIKFQNASELASDFDPAICMNLASAQLKTGDFDGALKNCDLVLKHNSNSDRALLKKGSALIGLKDYNGALVVLKQAITLASNDSVKISIQDALTEAQAAIENENRIKNEEKETEKAEWSTRIVNTFDFAFTHFYRNIKEGRNVADFETNLLSIKQNIRLLSSEKIIVFLRNLGADTKDITLRSLTTSMTDEMDTFLILPSAYFERNFAAFKKQRESAEIEKGRIMRQVNKITLLLHPDKRPDVGAEFTIKAQLLFYCLSEVKDELNWRFEIALAPDTFFQDAKNASNSYTVEDKNKDAMAVFWDCVNEFNDKYFGKEWKKEQLEGMLTCLKNFRENNLPSACRALFVRVFTEKCLEFSRMEYSIKVRVVCFGRDEFESRFSPLTTIGKVVDTYFRSMKICDGKKSFYFEDNQQNLLNDMSKTLREMKTGSCFVMIAKKSSFSSKQGKSKGDDWQGDRASSKRKSDFSSKQGETKGDDWQCGGDSASPKRSRVNKRGFATCPYCRASISIRSINDHKPQCSLNPSRKNRFGEPK